MIIVKDNKINSKAYMPSFAIELARAYNLSEEAGAQMEEAIEIWLETGKDAAVLRAVSMICPEQIIIKE